MKTELGINQLVARTISFLALVILLAAVSMFFTGCNRNDVPANSQPIPTVVVIKFVTHPALDELETGFISELTNKTSVRIEQHNASGNPQRAKELAELASRSDVHLIVAIATPAAQAVARTQSKIPLLYGAVANPESAGIIPSDRATGIRNAGPSIIEQAIQYITQLKPETKVVGTLYNPSEQNSVYVQSLIRAACTNHNLKLVFREVTDSTQISAMAEDLCNEADFLYSANDNTINAGVASLVAVTKAKRVPFLIGDLSTVSKGAVAAVGLEYRAMGRDMALMAEQLLSGVPVSQLPPREPPPAQIWFNRPVAEEIGLPFTHQATNGVQRIIGN